MYVRMFAGHTLSDGLGGKNGHTPPSTILGSPKYENADFLKSTAPPPSPTLDEALRQVGALAHTNTHMFSDGQGGKNGQTP